MNKEPELLIIPADEKPQEVEWSERQIRVAAYCRVSTDDEEQASSFEGQKDYYTTKIMENRQWVMEEYLQTKVSVQHQQKSGPNSKRCSVNANKEKLTLSSPKLLVDLHVTHLKDALAKRAEMDIVGYNYVQQRSFDTLEGAVTNPGAGQNGIMGAGLGLGLGVGLGGGMGQQMGVLAQNINTNNMKKCPKCSAGIEVSKRFCATCGFDTHSQEQASAQLDSVTCSNCSHVFPKNMKFCPNCGDAYVPCAFCGADIKPGSAVCLVCGKELPSPCPKCGVLLADKTIKFCPECGESLVKKCANCGTDMKSAVKFCPECGNKI